MADHKIKVFTRGIHNKIGDAESIPKDAAQDSKNYITKDGKIVLVGGRKLIGTVGTTGKITGQHFGKKTDGTKVHYRKAGTVIQYLNSSDVWTDTITGLEEDEDYSFTNYSSLAGNFTFINGKSAYYKINNANPDSAINIYNPAVNFYGRIFIDRGRTILWNREKDKTGLYGSKIDPQNATVYTTISGEAIGGSGTDNYTGTLVFKGAQAGGKTFTVVTATDIITVSTHGYSSGDVFLLTTSGTLPAGLALLTQYYIKVIDSNTFYLTSSPTLETIIDITDTGSGTHTINISGDRRNCFGVTFEATVAAGTESFTDNYDGTVTGDLGGSGTINYATGVYDITFSEITTGAVTSDYLYEDSTSGSLADFTFSATRLAAEGFQFPQDEGGDAILNVLIGQDGSYYSLKSESSYILTLEPSDLSATNEIYRKNIGIPYWKAAVSTSKGIVFLNTANPSEPSMTILQKNRFSADVEPFEIFRQFDFSLFNYDDAFLGTYDKFILVFCRKIGTATTVNDTILMCDIKSKTVDIIAYAGRTSVQDDENLFIGDSASKTVYQIFNGFDDLDNVITNYWIGKRETYGREELKKFKRKRIKGKISPAQKVEVYIDTDNSGFSLIGTILGSGSYVNKSSSQVIGANFIGQNQIGGKVIGSINEYFIELKVKTPKFRNITIKCVAIAYGYFDINFMMDKDILLFENRIPKSYRTKQNVSLDGASTDQ